MHMCVCIPDHIPDLLRYQNRGDGKPKEILDIEIFLKFKTQ